MGEVFCIYKWDEKKAGELTSWLKAKEDRHVIFVDEKPVLSLPHARMRCVLPTEENFAHLSHEFIYLPFTFEPANHPLLQQFADLNSKISLQAADFADLGLELLKNYHDHLLEDTFLAKDLYGKFTHIPAIVCGGGPSLPNLNGFQESHLILGCGAGVDVLRYQGVSPHFAVHVDPNPLHHFKESTIPLIYQLRTSQRVVSQYKGARFLMAGNGNFPVESWLQEKFGLEPVFDGGWTVGTTGVAIAALLGCNPIILAGLDFATDKTAYAPGVDKVDSQSFIPVKNRQGDQVFSRKDWVLAADWIENFVKSHPDKQFGTVSHRGLLSLPVVNLQQRPSLSIGDTLKTPIYSGRDYLQEIQLSFKRSLELCHKILKELEKSFPNISGTTALFEHDLEEELVYRLVLEHLWNYWQPAIRRKDLHGEFLSLHRILFFQSICESFCGFQ